MMSSDSELDTVPFGMLSLIQPRTDPSKLLPQLMPLRCFAKSRGLVRVSATPRAIGGIVLSGAGISRNPLSILVILYRV